VRMTWSANRKKTAAMATMTKTIAVVTAVSRRLGHVTFCPSTRTSCKNLNGLIFAMSSICRRVGRAVATYCALDLLAEPYYAWQEWRKSPGPLPSKSYSGNRPAAALLNT
jgi:hypothetical protein